MDIKVKKILLSAGSIMLMAVAFCFVPKINKKIADKLYWRMR